MQSALEFFAGIGLVRMALENAHRGIVFANDIDEKKYEIYKANFGDREFRLDDIRNVTAKKLPDADVATASFPCIDLSLAGNRAGLRGAYSSVFWHFYRLLVELRRRAPRFVLVENVTGLLTSHNGRDLRSIIEALNEAGYSCDLLVVDAVHFVPQSRPRLFILGDKEADENGSALIPDHPARPEAVLRFMASFPKLRFHHYDLPPLPIRRTSLKDIVERFDDDDPIWWNGERSSHLFRQMSPAHVSKLKLLCEAGEFSYATVYKRVRPAGCRAELRFDGIAGCLRTPRGGSSKQFIIRAGQGHWRVRNMTAREYARLQGVPDSFKIRVPNNQALFGFGDAVCVPAVTWVIKHSFDGNPA